MQLVLQFGVVDNTAFARVIIERVLQQCIIINPVEIINVKWGTLSLMKGVQIVTCCCCCLLPLGGGV